MAKKRNLKQIKRAVKVKEDKGFFASIKWGESYTSLALGVLVVIVATILLFSLVKGKGMISSGVTDSIPVANLEKADSRAYVVKPNDDLWTIAEKEYGSGYNWVDIANANKLTNPDVISEGTKLVIPNVKQRGADNEFTEVTVSQTTEESQDQTIDTVIKQERVSNSIAGKMYTVVEDDFLWDIAIRAYGDGYKWVDIANANNLVNPDTIFIGTVLNIPR
jgi:nucleoid-associated protein YgaU